jgi:PAS domain S-box-containing protein
MHDNTGSSGLSFLAGGGEAGALMRSMDWTASPLGSPRHWPQSLRTVVSLLLNSKFPMFVAWGPKLSFLYNDPYAEILGTKHPKAMGRHFKDIWSEIWSDIEPLISRALAGEATFHEDLPLILRRKGFDERTYFTFSYSPVRDETGGIGGMFCACTETTKEVETRAALQADREHLHRLFQQAPSMVCILSGPEHVFELANPIYLEFIGNRDVIGRKLREAVPELEGQGFLEILDNVYATGEPFVGRQIPVTVQQQDGSAPKTRYFDFVYQPITNEQGRITGIFAEGHDVTDLKITETALRASEADLAAAFGQAAAGFAETDLSGRFLRVNNRYCELVGRTREELLGGLRMQDITHPDDLPANLTFLRKALQTGEPFEIEKRYIAPDGLMIWVSNAVSLIRNEVGQPRSILAVSVDITARRKAEAALRDSESRLRLALDAGRMGVWESDTSTETITISPELKRLLGFPADATPTAEEIRSRYAPGVRERLLSAASTALGRGERHIEEELEVIPPDGSHRWVLLRADLQATSGPNGSGMRATGVAFDITERKRWEEHQRLLINELNHRVKNTLAIVQSLANQTFRDDHRDAATRLTFEGRLFALAAAHDVLTQENWEGAELREVVTGALAPYIQAGTERFHIEGPDLRLPPRMALAIAMALHELATNAVKYGALSVPPGRVTIQWAISKAQTFALVWREEGGPEVTPPSRKGFGTRMIERSLAQDIGGTVHLTYEPTGVVCAVEAPLVKPSPAGRPDHS